jgi:hypothetical protein
MTSFFAIEQAIRKSTGSAPSYALGHGSHPHGVLWLTEAGFYLDDTIRASDMGYRTRSTDPGGPIPYPPRVQEAFSIDVGVNLDPTAPAVGAAWGAITLLNNDAKYDPYVTGGWISAGRPTTILYGDKTPDTTRGVYVDPAYSALTPVFGGVAGPWQLTDTALTIPLRDASYWLERPLLRSTYGGGGGLDGTAALAGTLKPMAVGGSPTPFTGTGGIQNVPPVLVDPVNLIYQINDGFANIVLLYEGGYAGGITFAGDVVDLYAGSTPAGQYRTCTALGCFQLGSTPTRAITCDVAGYLNQHHLLEIAYYVATALCGMPNSLVATTSSSIPAIGAVAAATYRGGCGFWLGPNDNPTGIELLNRILGPASLVLVPCRDGTLRALNLAALPGSPTIKATIDYHNAVDIAPLALPATVDPPPYRIRVGYNDNYTQQTSDISPSATQAHKQYMATPGSVAQANSSNISAALARPNDPVIIRGSIVESTTAAAQTIAAAYAAQIVGLWGVRRRLYAISVPFSVGRTLEFGDVVTVAVPFDDLTGGQNGQIVGYGYKSDGDTITLKVLI